MSSVIVVTTIVGIVTGTCLLFVVSNKTEKQKQLHQLLLQFSELGSKYDMSFSGQEVLTDCIIGIDGIRRKLLIYKTIENVVTHVDLVDLREVKICELKKHYGTIDCHAFTNKKLKNHPERIALQLQLKHNRGAVEIPFYNQIANPANEHAHMEQKARYWEKLISKMVYVPVKTTT